MQRRCFEYHETGVMTAPATRWEKQPLVCSVRSFNSVAGLESARSVVIGHTVGSPGGGGGTSIITVVDDVSGFDASFPVILQCGVDQHDR